MVQEINGQITAGKAKYGIVISRFNEFISDLQDAPAVIQCAALRIFANLDAVSFGVDWFGQRKLGDAILEPRVAKDHWRDGSTLIFPRD